LISAPHERVFVQIEQLQFAGAGREVDVGLVTHGAAVAAAAIALHHRFAPVLPRCGDPIATKEGLTEAKASG
jgi:hypothetical protein